MSLLARFFTSIVLAFVVITTIVLTASAHAQSASPRPTAHAQSAPAPPVPHAPPAQVQPIDVSVATLEELVRLPGVGETRARAILSTRAARPFRRVQDLLRVPGIGRKTLARLLPYVTVGAPPRRAP